MEELTLPTPRAPLRILMTIGCLNIGGAERRLLQLLSYLRRDGVPIEVTFFVVSGAKGHLDREFKAIGAQIVYGRPSVMGLLAFALLARKLAPNIIHANSGSAGGFYCLAGRLAGVRRTISHIRSCGPPRRPLISRHALFYEPFTSCFSTVVLGVSSATGNNRNFRSGNWRVIHAGVDPAEIDAAKGTEPPECFSASGPNFVILGRFDRLKNIPHAIRSFAQLVKQNRLPHSRLHVVGPEGNQELSELRQLARTEGVAEQVAFSGATDEPLRYLWHASCALLCSEYEGLPGSVLEALACGTPVVASDIGPTREIAALTSGISVVPVSNMAGWVEALTMALGANRANVERDFWNRSPFPLARHADGMVALWSELAGLDCSK